VQKGLRLGRTYCESDLSSMHDFFRENAEEVQHTRQSCGICPERIDDVGKDVLPLGHLYGQICQADTQLQPDGLGASMERGQVAHDGCAQLGELFARHLVEVVDDLARSARTRHAGPGVTYFALEGRGSEQSGASVDRVRLYHDQCRRPCLLLRRLVSAVRLCDCPPHTDFWNCSRYWWAASFCARLADDAIMLCAASTGS
jgi:hypothetical protein